MIVEGARWGEILYVAEHLREKSRSEMYLFRAAEDPQALARGIDGHAGFKWTAYHEGWPAAIFGAYPKWPGVWGLYGFGTDAYQHVIREVTKVCRRAMMPAVAATGAHRAECLSPLEGHEDTHRWLQMLGAQHEATLRAYGKGGEDVAVFAWWKETADVR